MRKLRKKQIRWIIKRMEEGNMSIYQIAKQQGVSEQWVNILYKRYKRTSAYPFPRKPGPVPKEISADEKNQVLELRKEHPLCACTLEDIFAERGIHFPHNRIHRVLRATGHAKKEPKKSKRRKWIRYQRRHSNSLWHTDWFAPKSGKHLNIMEDDATRFITGHGLFKRETAKNAAAVFTAAANKHSAPKQLISDHGTTFLALSRTNCPEPTPNIFQKTVESFDTEHIKSRVKHPQSNGKVERVYQTIRALVAHFGSWDGAIEYYNYRRPHMSLNNGKLRTPHQAYLDKARKKKK